MNKEEYKNYLRNKFSSMSLDHLWNIYKKCSSKNIKQNMYIDEVEREIFMRTHNHQTMKIDKIYYLNS